MSDDTKKTPRLKPEPTVESDATGGADASKPRRMTLEELLEGMTPDKKPQFEDDWPIGEELI